MLRLPYTSHFESKYPTQKEPTDHKPLDSFHLYELGNHNGHLQEKGKSTGCSKRLNFIHKQLLGTEKTLLGFKRLCKITVLVFGFSKPIHIF